MFGYVKIAMLVIFLLGAAGGITYVMKLRADLAISEANNAKLESAVGEQKRVIEQQLEDMKSIRFAIKEQEELNRKLDESIKDLSDKFHKLNASGQKRDIGDLAVDKPKIMEKAINTGTKNALRCMEIAMGSQLTEKEKSASKKSEINPECYGIANPAYQPYAD